MAIVMRRWSMLIFLLWLVSVNAQFDWTAAALAYQNGDYATAIMNYEAAIAAGIRDGGVFFNLATAYAAAGDDAQALLNYLRAAEYLPRDSDTQLQIARLRARREDGTLQETNAMVLVGTLTNSWLTLGELSFLTWWLWVIFFGILAIVIQQKKWRRRLWGGLNVTGSLVCLSLLLLFSRYYVQDSTPTAVVIANAVSVMNGAGENYLPLFRVFGAAEVRILQTQDDWLRIVLPDGRQGWVRPEGLAKVTFS